MASLLSGIPAGGQTRILTGPNHKSPAEIDENHVSPNVGLIEFRASLSTMLATNLSPFPTL